MYIKEQWTNFLIVTSGSYGSASADLYKIPFDVDKDFNVTFGDQVEVKTEYVVVDESAVDDTNLTDADLQKLMNMSRPTRPRALDRIVALAAAKASDKKDKPYGDVTYADPGYKGGTKRYPINTAAHVRAAWSYINQEKNQKDYTSAQIATIKAKIKSAAKKFNITITD
jgi:hypothetical protein